MDQNHQRVIPTLKSDSDKVQWKNIKECNAAFFKNAHHFIIFHNITYVQLLLLKIIFPFALSVLI